MRITSIDNIKDGTVLAKSIYSCSGRLLLSKGIKLDKKLIYTLRKHQIYYVYIEDKISEGVEIESIIDDSVRIKAMNTMKKVFSTTAYQNRGNGRVEWIPLSVQQEVENVIEDILKTLKDNKNVLYSMTELMGTDMQTYRHSVNVAILSILTAKSLGVEEKYIEKIAMGGLLHDIGKSQVDPEILNKSGNLTEDEINIIKKHPQYGYEMVKENRNLSYIIKKVIYEHHELLDGSGYPKGLKDEEIDVYSRIITICDMFDSMTSDNKNSKGIPVYKALEILSSQCFKKIDAEIYSKFIENIAVYPIGTGVVLEDGRKGIVIDIHRACTSRPIIKIIEDKESTEYYEIDLMKKLTLFIKDTIDLDEIKL